MKRVMKRGPKAQERGVVNSSATQAFFAPLRLRRELGEDFSEPYRQHAWIYACIRAKAENISQVPFLIRRGNKKQSTVIEAGPAVDLFERPNPMMSAEQFKEAVIAWLQHSGDVKIVKEGRLDGMVKQGEMPAELWPLNGRLFKTVVDKKTKLPAAYMLEADGQVITYQPHQIIHIKLFNPYDSYTGMGPMDASMSAARQDYKASRYNEAFFDNDATPGGLLVSKGALTPQQRRNIRDAWEDRHRGIDKRSRVAVLEAGMEFTPNSQTHKDMEFLEQRKYSREEILAVFKVPKAEVALYEDVNFATAQSADKSFWTKSLIPLMKLYEGSFNKDIFGKSGEFCQFDYDSIEALRESLDTKLAAAERLQRLGYTANMINEKLQLGMPKLPWGDVALVPAGSTTMDDILLGPDEAEDEPDPATEPGEEDPEPFTDSEQEETVNAPLTRRGKADQSVWRKLVREVMSPNEAKFRAKFRRYLMDLRAEQLKLVKKLQLKDGDIDQVRVLDPESSDSFSQIRAIEDSLFDLGKWDKKIVSVHHNTYIQAATQAAEKTFEELGGNFAFDVSDPTISAVAERREKILVKANQTIRKRMAREIEAGVKAGETIQQIQERIRTSFNGFSAARSLAVARTEVAGTVNDARHEVMKAEGVEQVRWTTADDEHVRESHAEQDGVMVNVGQAFPNGLRFPGEPGADPSETVNCRCVTVAE